MRSLIFKREYELPYANTEAFNRLRVNLDLFGTRYKTILLSSSVPDEGKSYVSVNLWRSLAESGKKVLLIDTDIRKSMIRSTYRMSVDDGGEKLGLVNFLAEQAGMNDVVYRTNYDNAYIIPVFRTMTNPSILLQSELFDALLNRMKEVFDCIIIDTPPLDTVSDGLQIASRCDGAILVVRAGSTPRRIIASSIQQLNAAKCELLGVVLNRIDTKNSPYYYKYSRYGYYKYKYEYGYGNGSDK